MEPNVAATKIQSFWRVICARRKVVNVRLWKWCTNRNAVHIQCAWRRRKARIACEAAIVEREMRRALIRRRLEAERLDVLQQTIYWRGAACDTSARKIQQWWVWLKERGPVEDKGATTFFRAIKDAQERSEVLRAEAEAKHLQDPLAETEASR